MEKSMIHILFVAGFSHNLQAQDITLFDAITAPACEI
jgi:hypothetical protein